MNDFDKLSREELVALTDEELNGYISRECMKEGVRRFDEPVVPVYRGVPNADVKVFQVAINYQDIAVFMTVAEAEAFLTLKPVIIETEYPTGDYSEGRVTVIKNKGDDGEEKIKPMTVFSKASFERAKDDLAYNATAKTAYDKEMEIWSKNDEAVAAVLREMRTKVTLAEREIVQETVVLNTFKEYVELSGGEQETAFNFLQKSFGMKEICAAFVNNGVECDLDFGPIGWPDEAFDPDEGDR